jgi:iron complex transport system substrate-binding protein
MRKITGVFIILCLLGCRQGIKNESASSVQEVNTAISQMLHANGFSIQKEDSGISVITVHTPWPNSDRAFRYALVPKEKMSYIKVNNADYDAVIPVPVEKLIVTSTTHIPALEALGVEDRLIGFPGTQYISSQKTRTRIKEGAIQNIGNNESMNTEMVLALKPELVVGFGITSQNTAYETLIQSDIAVVYNGDWTEKTPLGKAEWIKFFAPFFGMDDKAATIFEEIESAYEKAKSMAKESKKSPSVMSGALYKDVWYAPGGQSWAAQFIKDANADYLWKETMETGSLSLSIESVIQTASYAEFWVSPSQFTSYSELSNANAHYQQFDAFKDRNIFTYALSKGETGGLLFYEMGPNRPDLILKDLIHIFHPDVLPDHTLFFFKPLNN